MPEVINKVPPHSIEAEQSVLGAMLLSEECVLVAIEKLKSIDFYSKQNRNIFNSMVDLFSNNQPIDMVTVSEKLGDGNPLNEDELLYLSKLMESVPSVSNIDNYIKIIKDKSKLRKIIQLSAEISEMSYRGEDDPDSIVGIASERIYGIGDDNKERSLSHIKDALIEGYANISKAAKSKNGLLGVATGFPLMDKKLSGLQPTQLIVIAGRPGMGKTSFALNIAEHVAVKENRPVAIFSLEMSREQLGTRLLCAGAGVDSQKARTGQLSEKDFFAFADAMLPLEQAPIYIDDTAIISPTEIMTKVRRLKNQIKDLGLVVIDYLQLMSTGGKQSENRQNEIATMSRMLKIAAKELEVPIIVLSQLSRSSEKRENKKPMLSDLRDSGAIEQDADVVLFLHREDYYAQEENKESEKQSKSYIIIAKQRSGPTGTIDVIWKGDQTKYLEVDFTED